MGQDNSHPKPGDLIEIDRPLHQHWALYLGNGYVISLTPGGKNVAQTLGLRSVPEYIRNVKKQLLKDVVGKDKWRVNNKYDQDQAPLPAEEIIRRAEGYNGKKVAYRVFGSNCEDFVTLLRYGDQLRAFLCGKMHIPQMPHGKRNPNPGDLMEIKQQGYQHWALYVGDGYVIHVTAADGKAPPLLASTEIKFSRKTKVKARKKLLREVAGDDDWYVNNRHDWYCTPLPLDEIIRRAERWIDKEVPYDELGSNCERFMTTLRYGEGLSFQLRALVCGEKHIPDMTLHKCYPNPGDLIEIKRQGYQHWALYVGDGYVIHVAAADLKPPSLFASTEKVCTTNVKVKKELLKVVARGDTPYVNNKYDWYHAPLPVEEIIHRAEGYIGKEVPCFLFDSNCEHFVKRLRYGDQLRAFVCVNMNIPDMPHGKCEPKPGDLIEIKRRGYQHWALYVGDGYVIHVTAADGKGPPASASIGLMFTGRATVKKELLKEVVKNDEWDVNKKYEFYRVPFPVEEIIRRAESWIGKEVPYRLLANNCEHFVTKLRYGEGVSDQLRAFLCQEIHVPEMAHDKYYPDPGDLIEIKRRGCQHWALYVGGGYVIHVTTAAPFLSMSPSVLNRRAMVKKEPLKEVVGNDDWDINNKYEWYRLPFPVEEIIRRAERWIGKEVQYDLLHSNSEHFVTMLRYGEGVSDQARKVLQCIYAIAGAAGVGLLGASLLPFTPFIPLFGVGMAASAVSASGSVSILSSLTKLWRAPKYMLEDTCC